MKKVGIFTLLAVMIIGLAGCAATTHQKKGSGMCSKTNETCPTFSTSAGCGGN